MRSGIHYNPGRKTGGNGNECSTQQKKDTGGRGREREAAIKSNKRIEVYRHTEKNREG